MVDFSCAYRSQDVGTDSFGDLLMANGDLVLTSDADPRGTQPILQDILRRLRTFLGECFVDLSLGVPYFQQLLGQKAPPSTWDAVLQNVVLQTPGVLQLSQWQSTYDAHARSLSLSFSAVTSQGNVAYASSLNLTS